VVNNANATQLDAIFWIEKVVDPSGGPDPYIQLQYVQRVILDFDNIHWPHISVATLVKDVVMCGENKYYLNRHFGIDKSGLT
jgi:hypothetical protein